MTKIRKCIKCGEIKELSSQNFQPSFDKKTGKTYYKRRCRVCERLGCKTYHAKNRSKILERKRKYDATHKIEKSQTRKERNQRPDVKKKNSQRALKRYYANKNNPIFILRERVSVAVNKQLKRQHSNKGGKSITKYLPYSIEELANHLESLFEPWMTWDNYGAYSVKTWKDDDPSTWKWNIDHIMPHSNFRYTSMDEMAFRECWDLSNLRPMNAKQNISDGATRVRHKR